MKIIIKSEELVKLRDAIQRLGEGTSRAALRRTTTRLARALKKWTMSNLRSKGGMLREGKWVQTAPLTRVTRKWKGKAPRKILLGDVIKAGSFKTLTTMTTAGLYSDDKLVLIHDQGVPTYTIKSSSMMIFPVGYKKGKPSLRKTHKVTLKDGIPARRIMPDEVDIAAISDPLVEKFINEFFSGIVRS